MCWKISNDHICRQVRSQNVDIPKYCQVQYACRDIIEELFEFLVAVVPVTPTVYYFQHQVLSWKIELTSACFFFSAHKFGYLDMAG